MLRGETNARTASFRAILSLLALLALAVPSRAQEPTLEDYRGRLPEQTILCVSWQNLSELETLRATNPLLRLLGSPEMKSNWKALEEYQRELAKRKPAGERGAASPARTSSDIADLARLAANPGFIALVAPPRFAEASGSPREPAMLFLYHATGKEELLARLDAQNRNPGEKRSTYEFEGTTVEETRDAEGKPKKYEARVGRWLVGGSERESFEAWTRAVREAPEHSLRDSATYHRAQSLWSPGSQVRGYLDVALLMESLRAVPPAKPGEPTAAQVFEALDLHRWELVTLDATLDASTVRYQVIGHQSGEREGLLGVLGLPVDEFPSLRMAPSSAVAYSAAQVDLLATWTYLLEAVDAFAPPPQAGMIQGVLAMAEGLLGMPLDELMAAWGDEYAQFSSTDDDGTLRSVYALSLRDREQVLATLRHVVAKDVVFLPVEELPAASETTGSAVYFRVMSGPPPPADPDATEKDEPRQPSLHLVVAGDWLLVSERKEDLEAALARAHGGSPFLGQSPAYQQARSRFPASLSGFSFVDAEHWLETDAAKQLLRAILEGAARTSSKPDKKPETSDPDAHSGADSPPAEDSAQAEEPPVPFPELQIPRGYLKWLLSATTRDAHSFRFVGIIE